MCHMIFEINFKQLTLFFTINPDSSGLNIPELVPHVLEIPIKIPPYFGAMSKWFIPYPEIGNDPSPTASTNEMIQ